MTIYKQFGMRVKYLRTQKGMSQEDLALEAGINKNYLSDIERGARNPTLKIMQQIADALNINLEVLFKGL
ncbi:MAG: helix-turn-helix domain-containing protein [Bacilli bacterium]|nr:helix-turn-helix domain-containing protein [Bacilli bacterium]